MRLNALSSGRQANPQLISKKRGKHHGQRQIDCTQIPRVQMDILCRTLLAGIERFYFDPENLRRYEAWLQKCREEGKFYDDDDTQTAAPAVQ